MKPHESSRKNKKSIRGDSRDSWPVWNRGITRYRYALCILAKFRPGSSANLKLVSLFWILGPTVEDLIKHERLHSHVIELEKMKSYLPSMLSALTSWS